MSTDWKQTLNKIHKSLDTWQDLKTIRLIVTKVLTQNMDEDLINYYSWDEDGLGLGGLVYSVFSKRLWNSSSKLKMLSIS